MADARLNAYYPRVSDSGGSQDMQDHSSQAHPETDSTTESPHSRPSEEEDNGITTSLSNIDLDREGSDSNGNHHDSPDEEDGTQLSSQSSTSISSGEESDENWESLEYIR